MAAMTDSDRRDFIKKSAAAAAALGISGAEVATGQANAPPAETLRAIGAAVLPAGDLGLDGTERVVADFEAWIDGFEPEAEMPHGYLNRGLANIRSDVYKRIWQLFKENDIEIPFPQNDINLRRNEPFEQLVAAISQRLDNDSTKT